MSEYQVKLRSNYLDGVTDVDVILPNPFVGHDPEKFYASGKKYPVLWLLHGGRNKMDDWITYTSVPRLGIWRNIIIVAPHSENTGFMNHVSVGEGYRYMDFFFHELMPFIFNWFPSSARKEDNFFAGNDLGAQAVWRYGLLYPEKFIRICPIDTLPVSYEKLRSYESQKTSSFLEEDHGLSLREQNVMRNYETVGHFLASIENTKARYEESNLLPQVFLPYQSAHRDVSEYPFKEGTVLQEYQETGCRFLEHSLEDFLEKSGVKEIERKPNQLPILPGVHNLDDSEGITIH